MTAAIEVSGLTKRFGREVLAVDGLSFTVASGEVCGLLGPNGAGKTTTVRMLLGLVRPDRGTTAVLGEATGPGSRVLGRVGALVERPAFVPHFDGLTNLKQWWRAAGGAWPPPGLDDALALADLGPALGRKVRGYSQGMRQRLGLAQALLGRPEVLMLDEPTNGLDPGEVREIRRVVRDLAGGGTTILVSSHVLAEVEQVCTSAVVMDRGRLVASGSVRDLVGAAQSVYLEVDDLETAHRILETTPGIRSVRDEPPGLVVELEGASRATLVRDLVTAGVGVETVTSRNRLEDAFLGLVGEGRA
ncbi:MAG TPA: ABC transporter ATP-binding protein [Acidimicrobiales bacterium]|nr:ABC transporter ATP-binding protein [Acidimicrobiales bacterium]